MLTPTLLIDAIVRQTVVLVAALATSSGHRAPLAHIADEVFRELVAELKQQGLANRVIADMFGMALRTYQQRIARASTSRSMPGSSLWAAVYAFVCERGTTSRADVLSRFAADDEAVVRAAIRDLVESGLIEASGKGPMGELVARGAVPSGEVGGSSAEGLVLVAVHELGPVPAEGIRARLNLETAELRAALERLTRAGTVRTESVEGVEHYTCDSCVIPIGDEAGWEGAVFDHYQALVAALVTKLSQGVRRSDHADHVGGSTFTIDLWEGHPMAHEVLDHLKRMREEGTRLRQRVRDYNTAHERPVDRRSLRVISYVGQTVKAEEPE